MISRKQREISDDTIELISKTYSAWKGDSNFNQVYKDIPGFCRSVSTEEIINQNFIIAPSRFVGIPKSDDYVEITEEMIIANITDLKNQMRDSEKISLQVLENLGGLGFDK